MTGGSVDVRADVDALDRGEVVHVGPITLQRATGRPREEPSVYRITYKAITGVGSLDDIRRALELFAA